MQPDAGGAGDGVWDQGRVVNVGQLNEDLAVREPRRLGPRELGGEAGLAGTPRPDDSYEPGMGQEPPELGQLLLAADEIGKSSMGWGRGGADACQARRRELIRPVSLV